MSTIVARATVSAHARLSDADTAVIAPVRCGVPTADAIVAALADSTLTAFEQTASLSPSVPFDGAAAVGHPVYAAGLDPQDAPLGDRMRALLTDADMPADYVADLHLRMRQLLDEVAAAEYLAANETLLRPARERLGLDSTGAGAAK